MQSERDVSGGERYELDIVDETERVPAILLLPPTDEPVPGALLLHGFGSRKERMTETVGAALLHRGVATLSVDLPLHGARGSPSDLRIANAKQLLNTWRGAVRETQFVMRYLTRHQRIDANRLGVIGHSLGSFLANIVASETANVQAVVLAASGDLPEGLPFESLVRAVLDPLRVVRRIVGRPLLMINGRFDRIVKPSQAERLFAAAHEPKTMRWYGGGHWPPSREIDHAATWLAAKLSASGSSSRRSRTRASTGG